MITLNKFDNKDSRYSCTSCHTMKEKTMYELLIGKGNGGMLMYLCPECANTLKDKTSIVEKTPYDKAYDLGKEIGESIPECFGSDLQWCSDCKCPFYDLCYDIILKRRIA